MMLARSPGRDMRCRPWTFVTLEAYILTTGQCAAVRCMHEAEARRELFTARSVERARPATRTLGGWWCWLDHEHGRIRVRRRDGWKTAVVLASTREQAAANLRSRGASASGTGAMNEAGRVAGAP
jgi:hypothetical protein